MFIDGMIGKNFALGLSFYLNYYRRYLRDLGAQLHVNHSPDQEQTKHSSRYMCTVPVSNNLKDNDRSP
jgi:hypothetical protein